MDKVILHIGDTVTHVTWGEGTVTDADEEFCTIKFAEKELTFRLPDAFENGFLTSDDAEIIDEDEDWDDEEDEEDTEEDEELDEQEDEDEEEPEPVVTPHPQENNVGCFGIGVAFTVPLIVAGPLAYLFFVCHQDEDGSFFLILAILTIVFYFIVVAASIAVMKKDNSGSGSGESTPGPGLGPSATLSAMMLGFWLGGRKKNHKSIFDSAHDSLFWQEKYHKDHYYDDEDF